MGEYLGAGMEVATFPHQQILDFEGLKGRLMSSSYAPAAGEREHEPLIGGLQQVFERHAHAGTVVFPYVTLVYFSLLEHDAPKRR